MGTDNPCKELHSRTSDFWLQDVRALEVLQSSKAHTLPGRFCASSYVEGTMGWCTILYGFAA